MSSVSHVRRSGAKGRQFTTVPSDYWPAGAVMPGPDQTRQMVEWRRRAISSLPSRGSKLIAAAWVLSGLAARTGYATISNNGLAGEISLAANKIDDLLRGLEQLGLIFRAHTSLGQRGFERRIWLLSNGNSDQVDETTRTKAHSPAPLTMRRNASALEEARREAERRDGRGEAQRLLAEIRSGT